MAILFLGNEKSDGLPQITQVEVGGNLVDL